MKLNERAPIRMAVDSFNCFLRGQLDIETLSREIGKSCSLLENDIPIEIQKALRDADSMIERLRFTVNTTDHRPEVAKVWREFEAVLSRNDTAPE